MPKPGIGPIRSYRDLIVWQRALDLVVEIYRLTKHLPRAEEYGLTAQMRRSAVSIPANIAEGHSRRATRDYGRFLGIADSSLRELETYGEVVQRVGFISAAEWAHGDSLCSQVGRMLTGLRSALNSRSKG